MQFPPEGRENPWAPRGRDRQRLRMVTAFRMVDHLLNKIIKGPRQRTTGELNPGCELKTGGTVLPPCRCRILIVALFLNIVITRTCKFQETGMSKRPRTESKKPVYVPKNHPNPPIPYAVSQPNRYWRIKEGLAKDVYWRKRYWRRRITGKGDYRMDYKNRSTGANWGGYLGSKAGEWLGGTAQRILGLGDYSIKKNVFMGGRLPEITNPISLGGNTIRFQEYLGDILTSGTD